MKIFPVIFAALVIMIAAGCHKNQGSNGNNNITGGGKGGNNTIIITPEAYNIFVDTCTIYIKYGSLDAPANGVYDDSVVCSVSGSQPEAIFTGLTKGLYYFYGVGYHSGYGHPPNVKGGAQQTVASTDTTYLVYLPTYSYYP